MSRRARRSARREKSCVGRECGAARAARPAGRGGGAGAAAPGAAREQDRQQRKSFVISAPSGRRNSRRPRGGARLRGQKHRS